MNTAKTKVWDLPTRLFHWSLASCFMAAFLTSESERWRDLHVLAGYGLAGLIAFRLVWGFIGNPQARFRNFWPTPATVLDYLDSLLQGHPRHYLGHNPAGAVAIFLLLGLGGLTAYSGWLTFQENSGEWIESLHELSAHAMLLLVGVHLCGVVASSWLHRENLILAMITGWKNKRENSAG
jgi:cytochrome b